MTVNLFRVYISLVRVSEKSREANVSWMSKFSFNEFSAMTYAIREIICQSAEINELYVTHRLFPLKP